LSLFFYFLKHRFLSRETDVTVQMLLFLNAMSILFLAYFMVQTSLYALLTSGFPSFITLFSLLVLVKERSQVMAFQFLSGLLICLLCLFFLFNGIKQLLVVQKNYYRNGDFLYTLFHCRGATPQKFWYNLTHFCTDKPNSPGAGPHLSVEENTCQRNAYHQELSDTVQRWSTTKNVLLFHRDVVEVLMEHHKINPLEVNPVNDGLVRSLSQRILSRIPEKVYAGDIVIVEKNLNILPLDYRILKEMNHHFNFIVQEETPHLRVYRLAQKQANQASDLIFPIDIMKDNELFTTSVSEINKQFGVSVLFDKDKDSIWFVDNQALNKKNVYSIMINLGDLYAVNDIKIWRRIDFRKPDYSDTVGFRFLENFNVELSVDRRQWAMVASEQHFGIENQYYFEAKMKPQKARYVRINMYSDTLQYFAMSEIEVFGEKVGSGGK